VRKPLDSFSIGAKPESNSHIMGWSAGGTL
jgi:hypothetical protein